MKTIAFCAKAFTSSVQLAAGVQPVTSPPITCKTFSPDLLSGADFLYVKLHGLAAQAFWYGDHLLAAVSAKQIATCELTDAIIFAPNCHLPESPMLAALFSAGAKAILAGPGLDYATPQTVEASDVLGQCFHKLIGLGYRPQLAYRAARLHFYSKPKSPRIKDTLGFKLYQRSDL